MIPRLITFETMPRTRRGRAGVSLVEVLISMFVLLFGLLGVAAMFPAGQYLVARAARYDRAAALGDAAFHDVRARGLVQVDASDPADLKMLGWATRTNGNVAFPLLRGFAVDPLGVAENASLTSADWFPYGSGEPNYRLPRVTVRDASGIMDKLVAEQIFVSHDDLSLELPSNGDEPARQVVRVGTDPIQRSYQGDYSWMYTVAPVSDLDATTYVVTVVVFYKRSRPVADAVEGLVRVGNVPSEYGGGEVELKSASASDLSGVKAGEWLMLTAIKNPGPRRTYGWYRILSVEEDTGSGSRWVSLAGPDWDQSFNVAGNIRAAVFDGVVAVRERTIRLDGS